MSKSRVEGNLYLEILDFLSQEKYVELSLWALSIYNQYATQLTEEQKVIFSHISERDVKQLFHFIEKLKFTSIENQTFELICNTLEQNKGNIKIQWEFVNNLFKPPLDEVGEKGKESEKRVVSEEFNLDKDEEKHQDQKYLNLIAGKEILVFENNKNTFLKPSIRSNNDYDKCISELQSYLNSPNMLFYGGKSYKSRGISSIHKLQAVYNEEKISDSLQKFNKYEKIINFIGKLNNHLQQLFSLNQIGIIIQDGTIYLVKWLQYINEDQLLSYAETQNKNVQVIDELGVKIGLELKDNLEFGKLVIFKKKKDKKNHELKTLFSLDEELFSVEKKKISNKASKKTTKKQENDKNKDISYFNFDILDDCNLFVKRVLQRIETGILLISQGKNKTITSGKDLDLYINITLEKLAAYDNPIQKIDVLEDLLSINTNIDNIPKIKSKFEENYLIFIKQIFQNGNLSYISSTLDKIIKLKLFQTTGESINVLIQTLVYLIDIYYVPAETIIEIITKLESWELNDYIVNILEQPQITAITEVVARKLNTGNIEDIFKFLTQYIKNHKIFKIFDILTLSTEILTKVFRMKYKNEYSNITSQSYLGFLSTYSNYLDNVFKSLSTKELNTLSKNLENALNLLSEDVEFLSFLNDKISTFIENIEKVTKKYVSERFFYKFMQNIIKLSPIAIFHNKLHLLHKNLLDLLIKYKEIPLLIEFVSNMVRILRVSQEILINDSKFFSNTIDTIKKSINILLEYKNAKIIKEIFLSPLKSEVETLLTQWYLKSQMPENDLGIHKRLIRTLIVFTKMKKKVEDMYTILSIKDFIWSIEHNEFEAAKIKYEELPDLTFTKYSPNIVSELNHILGRITTKNENLPHLQISAYFFHICNNDYDKLSLSNESFSNLHKIFIKSVMDSIIYTVQNGNYDIFDSILQIMNTNLLFLSLNNYKEIIRNIEEIYQYDIKEGEKLLHRIKILKIFLEYISTTKSDYISFKNTLHPEVQRYLYDKKLIGMFTQGLDQKIYTIFLKMISWLTIIMEKNFINQQEIIVPFKKILKLILQQYKNDKEKIGEVKKVLHEFFIDFTHRDINLENKKRFINSTIEMFPKRSYPKINLILKENLELYTDFYAIEVKYYSQKDKWTNITDDNETFKRIINNENIITHFSILILIGNIYLLENKFEKAIEYYKIAKDCKGNANQSARLWNNFLYCLFQIGEYDLVAEYLRKLDIGIRTNPNIVRFIEIFKKKSGVKVSIKI